MKESIEMQNEFEDIILELEKLKSTNENLNQFKELIGTTAIGFIEVNEKSIELFKQSQNLVGKIDKYIEKYKSILEEQIEDLKSVIRDLKKLLKELDLEGIVTTAKTELIDALNAKTEILLEKLGGLGMAIKSLADQTEGIHKLCTKEFPALSEKIGHEAAKVNDNIQKVKTDTQFIIETIDQIEFPRRFKALMIELEKIFGILGYVQNSLTSLYQLISEVSDKIETIKSFQIENQKILEKMDQRISTVENRLVDISNKMESNLKTQRLQFIILLVVIVGSWIVLMLK